MVILNLSSLYNLESAAVFKEVEKKDIEAVEMFIRHQLYDILQSKSTERGSVYDDTYNSIFFGLFSSMREKFEFTVGDRKKLDIIINHVKDVVNLAGNYSHFDLTKKRVKKLIESWDIMLVTTSAGLFFGDISQNSSSQLNTRNFEELKRVLIGKVKEYFESYEAKDKKQNFNENGVTVACVNGKYNGRIECLLCERHELVVNYKLNGRSGSWLFSNLFKHVKKHHAALYRSSSAKIKTKRSASPSDDVKQINKHENPDENQHDSYENDSHSLITNTRLQNIIRMNNSLLEMKIEPLISPITNKHEAETNEDLDDLEDTVYLQCSTQIIKMKNACISNNEKDVNFLSRINFAEQSSMKEVQSLQFCQVKGDGNCLYASIAHQLFQMKINSIQHSEFTQKLRMEVVRYISVNLPNFIHYLKGRVYEMNDHCAESKNSGKLRSHNEREIHKEEIALRCKSFVGKLLAGGTWGGTESIKAISEIYEVNILIINEDGSCNMVGSFKVEFNRTIMITYRSGNHYDSVSVMDDKTILHFARSLVAEQRKQVNDNLDNKIEID